LEARSTATTTVTAQRGSLYVAEEVAAAGVTMMPALGRLRVLRQWGGVMDMTMDGSPIISRTPYEGLILKRRMVLRWLYKGHFPAGGDVHRASDRTRLVAPTRRAPGPWIDLPPGAPIDERGIGPYPYAH